jgi:hypothetical protein
MALAIGADLHRDTNEDTKLPEGEAITYAKIVPGHGESARTIGGLFAEIDAPVTKTLNLDAAVRVDHYSDVGSTVTPKISFRWQPAKAVMFRGSANTGFRAPTLFDRNGYRTAGANTTTSGRWDDPVLCPSPTPTDAGHRHRQGRLQRGRRLQRQVEQDDRLQLGPGAGKIERRHAGRGVRAEQHGHAGLRLLAGQHEEHAGQPAGVGLLRQLRAVPEPVRA